MTNNEMRAFNKVQRLRERAQILREQSATIARFVEASNGKIDERYAEQYGENWREVLPANEVAMIENSIRIEKMNASSLIEEQIVALRSTTPNISLVRK